MSQDARPSATASCLKPRDSDKKSRDVERQPSERIARARETLEAIQRAHPSNDPSIEDIANLHEVHARHEREDGYEERAVAAEERARQTRKRAR